MLAPTPTTQRVLRAKSPLIAKKAHFENWSPLRSRRRAKKGSRPTLSRVKVWEREREASRGLFQDCSFSGDVTKGFLTCVGGKTVVFVHTMASFDDGQRGRVFLEDGISGLRFAIFLGFWATFSASSRH